MKKLNYRMLIGLVVLGSLGVLNFKYAYDGYGNALITHAAAETGFSGIIKELSGKVKSAVGSVGNFLSAGISNTFQGQGWTPDERVVSRPCPTTETTSKGGSISVTLPIKSIPVDITVGGTVVKKTENSPAREEIICPAGNSNCTPVPC